MIETQSFTFDDAFDAQETNEAMYARTIAPLVSFLFDGGKASCFAYGQTGSGTFCIKFHIFLFSSRVYIKIYRHIVSNKLCDGVK